MSILPDDTYDAIVIDVEQAENGDIRLEITITLGPPNGRVIALVRGHHVDTRRQKSPIGFDPLDLLGIPGTLIVRGGCSVVSSGGRVTARVTATCRPRTFTHGKYIVSGPAVTVLQDPLAVVRTASRKAGNGVYLGAGTSGPVWATPERAVLVLGPPRSGKTSSIIVPSVLAANGPVVSTSTKPDVMTFTEAARARVGEIHLYDPSGTVVRPKGVAPLVWSPISACSQWDEALLAARLMVVSSTGGSAGTRQLTNGLDNHWHERSSALLAALLHSASLDSAPMSTVLKWVDRHQAGPAQSILDQAGNELAGNLLAGIATTDQRELSSIWSTTSGVLNAYHSNAAMASTTGSQFDPSAWCETAGTIYICASARHQELISPLVVALLAEIRTANYERDANRKSNRDIAGSQMHKGRRGNAPLLFALDEVANIAPLPDLGKTLGEGGGQGLTTLACLQDLSQARRALGSSG